MNATTTVGFVIQNKVFGSNDELVRWAQMKSYRSKSAVTRYLREWILPLRHNNNYRIEATYKRGDGERISRYLSVEDWFAAR